MNQSNYQMAATASAIRSDWMDYLPNSFYKLDYVNFLGTDRNTSVFSNPKSLETYSSINTETDVQIFITEHNMQPLLSLATKILMKIYNSISLIQLDVLSDEDNYSWLAIQIKTSLKGDVLKSAYDQWVDAWVNSTHWPRRALIKLEHIL